MKNILLRTLASVVLALVLIFLGRDIIICAIAKRFVHSATGLHMNIGRFHSSLAAQTIQINDLKLYNPPAYSEKIMFDLPEVFVAVDGSTLGHANTRLKEMRLHVAQVTIERNKEGKLNLSELKPEGGKKNGAQPKDAPPANVQIDVLKLRIDKVIYKDFSSVIPLTREFDLNINKTYTNIKDLRALAPIVIGDALRSSALSSLINFNVSDLLQNFQTSGITVADLGLDKLSGLANSGVGQTAQSAVTSVADQLGSLFGGSSTKK